MSTHAVGSGLKAAALLNNHASAPSCYVTTGGTGTSMTGVGHYVIHPGGDPSKAGLKVEDIACISLSCNVFLCNVHAE